ncbi:MAG TPA: AAA family ATPase [Gallionella sp.]|jgi:flagellar biosynthesis protein FlhG|nr:AAA family ATPase [Gallionella sp.]
MLFEGRIDQAEGLRRLLISNRTQVIGVAAGKSGVGCTTSIINLAAALVRSGKNVLVLDENHAPDNLAERLGLSARYDLLDAALGKCKLVETVMVSRGLSVLPAARAADALAGLPQYAQQRLKNVLADISNGVDVLLVDTAMPASRHTGRLPGHTAALLNQAGAAMLLVMDTTVSGITGSYALIKRLALESACSQFSIVINKAVDELAAMNAFNNMAAVAWRNLAVRLTYLGRIPHDEKLKRATRLGKAVVEAFPDSVSACACVALSGKLLRLPVSSDQAENGTCAILHDLIRQLPQRDSRENEVSSLRPNEFCQKQNRVLSLQSMVHVVN